MNRIYQGRVTKVETLNGKNAGGQPQEFANWQSILWQHHELFQDAVNYYTLALAAMAAGCADGTFHSSWVRATIDHALADPKLKENTRAKAERDAEAQATDQLKALLGWAAKVRETWTSASRKAEMFAGPAARLAPILQLAPDESEFEKACVCALRSSRATPAQRSAALLQLLSNKGDLNQVCVARLPWLATAAGKFTATSQAAASSQEAKRQHSVRQFHQWPEQEAIKQAPALDLGLFLTQPSKEFAEGADAAGMLAAYFAKASAKYAELKTASSAFEKFIAAQDDTFKVPSPGRKPSGIYPIAAVLKFFPSPETLAAFRRATKALSEAKDKEVVSDAVAEARVADQPHFDYFTNLALVAGEADERDTRAVWFEFDLAAFIEAIKAPRRYFEDTLKREAAAERLRQQIAAMEGKGREASVAEEEAETIPGFEGDTRIVLLKAIVQNKLAWLGEVEGDVSGPAAKEYVIRERTVRGFGEIKRRWRAAAAAGRATEQRLIEILAEEQTEHRDDFGSATLYREFAKPDFHPIWRDGGTQHWHAEDPLAAWLDYKELQAELQDKERPIRFTPAHPKCSPRFFIFPKKSEARPKATTKRPPKPGLLSRHEPGLVAVAV